MLKSSTVLNSRSLMRLFLGSIALAIAPLSWCATTVTSFSPVTGPVTSVVTIAGTNFSTTKANNTVTFNTTAATVTSATATQIIASVPTGATTGTIKVKVGTSTGTSASSFTITPAPSISSFTPGAGPVSMAVTITGTNFSTTAATNIVKFNGTLAVPTSATTTQIVVAVPSGATTGPITVTLGTVTAASATTFTVTPAPTIIALAPSAGPITMPVTITGTNFSTVPSANIVKFHGVAATPTSATATQIVVPVPTAATTGTVTVSLGTATAASAASFTVTPAPMLTSFSPSAGPIATVVTLVGTNFSTTASANTVKFNGTAAIPTTSTATQIAVPVPPGATSGTITVSLGTATATSTSSFTVPATPAIASFSPGSGPIGQVVTLTGTHFSATASANTIKFNGTAATATSSTATQIVVPVPSGASSGPITVVVGGVTGTSATSFTVLPTPTIVSVSPASGPVGQVVTLTGTNFSTTASANTVKFNGTAATPTTSTATQIVVPVPSGAPSGVITVSVGGATATSATSFSVTAAPSIASFSPISGPVGQVITLTGTNFSSTASANRVNFGGTTAVPNSSTSTQIVVPVPTGAATGPITVTVAGLTGSSATPFTVTPPPTITSFSPSTGPVSLSVTIAGTNFSSTSSANTVKFNGTTASPTSATSTQIVVPVPRAATTGPITVAVGTAVASSAASFTVTPAPTITSFGPGAGPVSIPVTIIGTNFSTNAATNVVKFNGIQAIPTSATSTQIVVPVPTGATMGTITVALGTAIATSASSFTVTAAPTLTSFSPGTGSVGTTVTLVGTNFSTTAAANAVAFNGVAATPTSAMTNQIVVSVPAGATTGPITVKLGTATATSASNFTVAAAPTVVSVTPGAGPVSMPVTIAGTNFSTTASLDVVTFNGIAATPTSVSTSQIIVPVPTGATTGVLMVKVGGATATGAASFTVTPAPTITSFTPTLGPIGTVVTLTGTNFSGTLASNLVKVNGTAAVPTSATATQIVVPVPTGATSGPITIALGSAVATSASTFTVGSPVAITGFSPASGVVSDAVTITGTNFDTTRTNDVVAFNGVTQSVGQATATQLIVGVPPGATTGTITVTAHGQTVSSATAFVVPLPTVTGFSPTSGSPGDTIAITGTNFGLSSGNVVAFNGTSGTASPVSRTQINATVPNGATTGPLVASVGGQLSAASAGSFIVVPVPSVTGITPNPSQVGATVTINGTNFDTNAANDLVWFDGYGDSNGWRATAISVSATQIVVTVPPRTTSGSVYLSVDGRELISPNFVVPAPSISGFSPTRALAGTSITVTGQNFSPVAANNTVKFNGIAAIVTASSGTQLIATLPAGNTSGPLTVTIGSLTATSAANFALGSAPVVTGFSPAFGPAGTIVTLAGNDFNATPSANAVTFNGHSAVVTTASSTQLTVVAPPGLATGPIAVTSGDFPGFSASSFLATTSGSTLTPNGLSVTAASPAVGQPIALTFNATAGQSFGLGITSIIVNPSGSSPSAYVYLPDGTPLVSRTGVVDFAIDLPSLPATGMYTVRIFPNSASAMVSAVTTLTNDTSVVVSPGVPYTLSTAAPGQVVRLAFDATAGQSKALELEMPPDNRQGIAVNMTVYRPDGAQLQSLGNVVYCFSCQRVFPLIHLPLTGAYTIDIQQSTAAANIAMQVSVLSPTPLVVNGPAVDQTVIMTSQVGLLSFPAIVGQRLELGFLELPRLVNPQPPSYEQTYLTATVYQPDGVQFDEVRNCTHGGLVGFPDHGCGFDFSNFTVAGDYIVLIHRASQDLWESADPVEYIANLSSPASLPILVEGSAVTLAVSRTGQTVTMPFSGTAGQNLQLGWSYFPDVAFYPYLNVYNPDGSLLEAVPMTEYGPSADLPSLPSTGIYRIEEGMRNVEGYSVNGGHDSEITDAFFQLPITLKAVQTCADRGGPIGVAMQINSITPNQVYVGDTYTVTPVLTAVNSECGVPVGTVTVTSSNTSDSCSFATPAATSCGVQAHSIGLNSIDASFTPADSSLFAAGRTVEGANTARVLYRPDSLDIASIAPEPSNVGKSFTVNISLASVLAGDPAPTGVVYVAAAELSCVVVLPATSCSLTPTRAGPYDVTAIYYSDGTYVSIVNVSSPHLVVGNPASVSITNVAPEPSMPGQTYTVSAAVVAAPPSTLPPTGVVTIDVSDQSAGCTFTLPDTGCDLIGGNPGSVNVSAAYSGDNNYSSAQSILSQHAIGGMTAEVTITGASPEPSYPNQPYTVTVSVAGVSTAMIPPTGTVSVSDGTGQCSVSLPATTCVMSGGVHGSVSLVGSYSGDSVYGPSSSAPLNHTINSVPGQNGTEIVGFDPSLPNTDPPGWVPITQMSGAVGSAGLSVDIVGTGAPLSIAVLSPSGPLIDATSVDIVGTISGPVNTGVTINGSVALTSRGKFFLPNLPLGPGQNEFAIVATTLPGDSVSAMVGVASSGNQNPVTLTANHDSSYDPSSFAFTVSVGALPLGATIQSIQLDMNGDGVTDYTLGALPASAVAGTFASPGVYTVTALVTDSNNATYRGAKSVAVLDFVAQRSMLADVYGYVKNRLMAQDASGAVLAYHPRGAAKYLPLFVAFGSSMPSAAGMLGTIVTGSFASGYAQLTLVRDNPDHTRNGFPLRMSQGADGVWRIDEM